MKLRELRMWHWREAMKARNSERQYQERADASHTLRSQRRKDLREVVRKKRHADFHIGAVQALNDAVWDQLGPGAYWPTADDDCTAEDNKSMMSN